MQRDKRDAILITLFEKLLNDENTEIFKYSDYDWDFANEKILKNISFKNVRFNFTTQSLSLGVEPNAVKICTEPTILNIILTMIHTKECEQGDKLLEKLFEKSDEDLSHIE